MDELKSQCESCQNEHTRLYGSGRFCSNKCAKSFSTKQKRSEINKKVSETIKSQVEKGDWIIRSGFKIGFDERRAFWNKTTRPDIGSKISKSIKKWHDRRLSEIPFEKLSQGKQKEFVLKEQNNVCLWCGLNKWRNQNLVLELDHIDGRKDNKLRSNLRILCPNCHSQTGTWRKIKSAIKNGGIV